MMVENRAKHGIGPYAIIESKNERFYFFFCTQFGSGHKEMFPADGTRCVPTAQG
jgi:hypothetical protein